MIYSILTVYWVTRDLLICVLVVLNVAELSQALPDVELSQALAEVILLYLN